MAKGARLPLLLLGCIALLLVWAGQFLLVRGPSAQTPGRGSSLAVTGRAVRFAISPAATDVPSPRLARPGEDVPVKEIEFVPEDRIREARTGLPERSIDGALQSLAPTLSLIPPPMQTFEGLSNENNAALLGVKVIPPDTNGDIGPHHYVQMVNVAYQVYSKSGLPLGPPRKLSDLFATLDGPCATADHGDPVVLYDPLADRWLLSQLCLYQTPNFHQLIAISQGSDPRGAYFVYDFMMPNAALNDYGKFGVWPDGYYMTDNQFDWNDGEFIGGGVFAFDRDKMLAGDPTASYLYFNLHDLDPRLGGMLPSDMDGLKPPPRGTPNYFAYFTADEFGDPGDALRVFEFHADFTNPERSTFIERPESPLSVAAFDPRTPAGRGNIPQPPPTTEREALDAITDRLLHRLAYRNFGDHESLVVNHSVHVGSGLTVPTYQAGVRYYELRRPLPGGAFAVNEQATFAPDGDSRWMGSAAMDHDGNLAVAYTAAGLSSYPAIRYAGRLATDPPGGLFQGENTLMAGAAPQVSNTHRWGDYSALDVDPYDDCTFWLTSEYYAVDANAAWQTRIGRFAFPSCRPAPKGGLAGVVRNAVTGLPIAGVSVRTTDGFSSVTDASGAYQMAVTPGSYDLTVSGTDWSPQQAPGVGVDNGGVTTRDFALVPHLVPLLKQGTPGVSSESCSPGAGVIDPGETVTLALPIRNVGKADTVDLRATLLATGGVLDPDAAQDYGVVPRDGTPVFRSFTFKADPNLACGTTLKATLQLTDGGADAGTLAFDLPIGGLGPLEVATYSSGALGVRIPSIGTLEVPIDVPDSGIISDIDVGVRLNDSHNENLAVSLVHPDGTSVSLYRHGGSFADRFGANFGDGQINCTGRPALFDDGADWPILFEVAPYTRVPVRPVGLLSTLNGKQQIGTFRLRIDSTASDNVGVVGCVQLRIARRVPLCCPYGSGSPSIAVAPPAVAAAESCHPGNGAADRDEAVTMDFPLRNVGYGSTTNLVATLLPGGGVEAPSGPASYGALGPVGAAVSRPFSFVPRGTCDSSITATFSLEDVGGAGPLGTVPFPVHLGRIVTTTQSFANPAPFTLSAQGSGASSIYPSEISTIDIDTGPSIHGNVSKVTVDLLGLSYPFSSRVNVLLVGPRGQKVVLMSGAGQGYNLTNASLTFDDDAPAPLPIGNRVLSGTFRPTAWLPPVNLAPPAPQGPYPDPQLLSIFNGIDANGTWQLFVAGVNDRTFLGQVQKGWRLNITTSGTVCCDEPCSLPCPAAIRLPSDPAGCGAAVSFAPPASVGSCGVVTCEPAAGSRVGLGTTTGTCTSIPGSNAPATTCGFDVTVTAATSTRTDPAAAQYSDLALLNGVIDSPGCPAFGGTLEWRAGGAPLGSIPVLGSGPASLTPPILLPAGTRPLEALFVSGSPGLLGSSGSATLTVAREDATVELSPAGLLKVPVGSPGGTGSVPLAASVSEVTDGHPGVIANAVPVTFTLVPVGPGSSLSCTAPSGTDSGGTLTVTCPLAQVPVEIYDVTAGVGGDYYAGTGRGVVAVFDPARGPVIGRGTIVRQGVPGDLDVTVRYGKNGAPQGSFQYVEHRPAGDLVLVATSTSALSIAGSTGVLMGTATIGGAPGYGFRAIMVDDGGAGRFGLSVTGPSGSAIPDLSFAPGALKRGAVRVR